MMIIFSFLYILQVYSTCPTTGNYLNQCERCTYRAQCSGNLICSTVSKLCVPNTSHTCSGDSGASCDNTNLGCSDVLSSYPSNCNCQESSFPDNWVTCDGVNTDDITTTNAPTTTTAGPNVIVAQLMTGFNKCSESSPCADGYGDCNSNAECEGNLICFNRRTGDETRNGYDFSQIWVNDICVQGVEAPASDFTTTTTTSVLSNSGFEIGSLVLVLIV